MQEHRRRTPTHAGSLDSAINGDQHVPTSNLLAVNCTELEERCQELCYMVLVEALNRPVR